MGLDFVVPVSRFTLLVVVEVCNTSYNNGTKSPEHLQHLSRGSSQLNWSDLTAIRWCVGNEDSPWKTLQKLRYEENRKGVAEVEHEDETVQSHQANNSSPAVSESGSDGASDEDTHQCTKRSTRLECRLPTSIDNPFTLAFIGGLVPESIFLGKRGQGDEVAHEKDTVCLQDLKMGLAIKSH